MNTNLPENIQMSKVKASPERVKLYWKRNETASMTLNYLPSATIPGRSPISSLEYGGPLRKPQKPNRLVIAG